MSNESKPSEILDVTAWNATNTEHLGTKAKEWLESEDSNRWLFKQIRKGTGEDWAEKAAAELASLLELPHAEYEMAIRRGASGSISLDLTRENGVKKWWLLEANEFLVAIDPKYPRHERYKVSFYTVDRALEMLERLNLSPTLLPDGTSVTAPELFVGYLLFDAWIANQDRHHENWAILFPVQSGDEVQDIVQPRLAPSYDHAACLGQHLGDVVRERRLRIKDLGHINMWVGTAKGALYGSEQDKKPLSPLDAFKLASDKYGQGAGYWLDKLASVASESWESVINQLPSERVSPIAREFAITMLSLNHQNLLKLR